MTRNRDAAYFRLIPLDFTRTAHRELAMTGNRTFTSFALLLVAFTIAFAVYNIGLDGPFLLDDRVNLSRAHIDALTPAELREQLFAVDSPYPAARGLTRISFALTRYTSGDGPRAFKYQNLMLHLLCGTLVFWLFLLLFSYRPPAPKILPPAVIAALVTAIWLLHPLQVSTVLYAVQRLVTLSGIFITLALISYVKGRLLAERHPFAGISVALVGVPFFAALGLISKETAVLIPLLIATTEIFIFQFRFRTNIQMTSGRDSLVASFFIGLFVVPVLLGAILLLVKFNHYLEVYQGRDFSMLERLMTPLHALFFYLKLIFVPLPNSMSLFHDNFPVVRNFDFPTALIAVTSTASIVLALIYRKAAPWIGFGVVWYFANHLLESTLLPLELVFEHRNYLALIGPSILVVLFLAMVLRSDGLRWLRPVAFIAVISLLAFNTHARAMVWSNLELMLVSQYEQRPESGRVLSNLINLTYNRGEHEEAFRYLRELQAVSDHEAAPFVSHLRLQCHEDRLDQEVFQAAQQRLSTGIISAFTSNSLLKLSQRVWKGQCPTVSEAQLGALLASAAENDHYGPGVRCRVNEMNTRYFITQRESSLARQFLEQALVSCGAKGKHSLKSFVELLLVFSRDLGHLDWTVNLLNVSVQSDDEHVLAAFADLINAGVRPD
jgi:hypothetical protein